MMLHCYIFSKKKNAKICENRTRKRKRSGINYQRWRVLPSRAGMVQELGD